jgi:epoxide hydrolase 4
MKTWQMVILGAIAALLIIVAGFVWVYMPVSTSLLRSQAVNNRDGDREALPGGLMVTHHFLKAGGITWHYVEAGKKDADTIVFLHGFPESWYSWYNELQGLADNYRVIAVDMKGYGQSEKANDDYHAAYVAEQVSALTAAIGIDKYALVTHDWGTVIGDYLAARDRARVSRYIRGEASVLIQDLKYSPQLKSFKNQSFAHTVMSAPGFLIRSVYGSNTVQTIPEPVLNRIAIEFSRDGVADAVPRYFRDLELDRMLAPGGMDERKQLFQQITFPVLLLQADSDPRQPQWYFDRAAGAFPDARLQWIKDSGHFSELEQPQQFTRAIRDFLSQAATAP